MDFEKNATNLTIDLAKNATNLTMFGNAGHKKTPAGAGACCWSCGVLVGGLRYAKVEAVSIDVYVDAVSFGVVQLSVNVAAKEARAAAADVRAVVGAAQVCFKGGGGLGGAFNSKAFQVNGDNSVYVLVAPNAVAVGVEAKTFV